MGGCGDEDVQVRGRGRAAAGQGQEDFPLTPSPRVTEEDGRGRGRAGPKAAMVGDKDAMRKLGRMGCGSATCSFTLFFSIEYFKIKPCYIVTMVTTY